MRAGGARILTDDWSDYLPELSHDVRRLPESSGLCIVPVEWVWSRRDLIKRGSEIIYVMVDKFEA